MLLKQHLARNRLDVGVGELDADREAVHQLVQQLYAGERRLTGAYQHHLAVELLLETASDDLGDQDRAGLGVADVLLDFVEDQDRAGHLAVASGALQNALEHAEELVGGEVRRLDGELGFEGVLRASASLAAKCGSHCEQRFRDQRD